MKCKEVENNLIFFIEGNLAEVKMLDIKNHINKCANCNALFQKLKADLLLIDKDKVLEANPFFYNRLEERLQKEENSEPSIIKLKTREVYIQIASYAAGIVLAIFLGVGLGAELSNTEIVVEESEELSDYQMFADSYNLNQPSEDAYELEVSEKE